LVPDSFTALFFHVWSVSLSVVMFRTRASQLTAKDNLKKEKIGNFTKGYRIIPCFDERILN